MDIPNWLAVTLSLSGVVGGVFAAFVIVKIHVAKLQAQMEAVLDRCGELAKEVDSLRIERSKDNGSIRDDLKHVDRTLTSILATVEGIKGYQKGWQDHKDSQRNH